jgi:hypothetical protein
MGRGGQNLLYGNITEGLSVNQDNSLLGYLLIIPDCLYNKAGRIIDSSWKSKGETNNQQPLAVNKARKMSVVGFPEHKMVLKNDYNWKWIAKDGGKTNWAKKEKMSKAMLTLAEYDQIPQDIQRMKELSDGPLIKIFFNKIDDNKDTVFFHPVNTPELIYNDQTNEHLKSFIEQVNNAQTLVDASAIAAVELAAANNYGSWFYDPRDDLKQEDHFHLYYQSNRSKNIGYLQMKKKPIYKSF